MKAKFEFQALLKPSAQVNFSLLPDGAMTQLIGGTDSKFVTGVSRYYEGMKIVLSSVVEEEVVHKFLDFIHPALRHGSGDTLGYFTFDNKTLHLLVYTPEKIHATSFREWL